MSYSSWFVMGVIMAYAIGLLFVVIPMPVLTEDCEKAYNHDYYYVSQCNNIHLEGWIETLIPSALAVFLIAYGIKESENFNYLVGSALLYGFIVSTFGLMMIQTIPILDCSSTYCQHTLSTIYIILGTMAVPIFLLGWVSNQKKKFSKPNYISSKEESK